jgi:site-specific DNA-methyltransferase (adenine-specific)
MNEGLFTSKTDEWATPAATFAELDAEFHFDLDPCADANNHKCADYYTKEQDGLAQNWGGAQSVLQPALWQSDCGVGTQEQRRSREAGHAGRYADTSKDGHGLLPRLHLPQGTRDPFHTRTAAFQREPKRGAVPVYDCCILTI